MMYNDYEMKVRLYDDGINYADANIIFDDENKSYEVIYDMKNYDYYEGCFIE